MRQAALESILTLDELAAALDLTPRNLRYWTFLAHSQYLKFEVPKRHGGTRTITAPLGAVRIIQRRIYRLLCELYVPRTVVHGFVKHRSILTNALPHCDRNFVLNVDLKDFFPSINFGRVRGALIAKPLSLAPNIATVLARLSCTENQLPQGAPTSPFLANLVCFRLDSELFRLAKSFGCTYTRYADDITISTHQKKFPSGLAHVLNPPYGTVAAVGGQLEALIQSNGFEVNEAKVRLYGRQTSQRVTGLIVNEVPNVDRKYVRQIRGMIHAWKVYGLDAAEHEFRSKHAGRHRAPYRPASAFRNVLVGKLRYLAMIKGPANPTYVRMAKQCRALDASLFPHALDGEERVDRSVWVLECDESGYQGTGVIIDGIGLVTCHHILGPNTKAFHPSDPYSKYAVTVVNYDEHLDLAILKMDGPCNHSLTIGGDELHRHQKIMVAGYPNYGYGDSIYKAWGVMTMTKVRSGVNYIVPDFPIAAGNSGGPIVDEHYRVVGIAVKGVRSLLATAGADPDIYAAVVVRHLVELNGRNRLASEE